MTTNIDRAAEVIADAFRPGFGGAAPAIGRDLAHLLADAGVLAPALPDGWRLADHEDHGRVIVTTPTPDDDGDVYFAFPFDDLTGYDWDACHPDELTFLDQGAADATD